VSIAIVLDEPENPDNIGAAMRAMRNMGLSDLRLVNPPLDWKKKASVMAVGTAPFLNKAKVFTSLKEAISDIYYVVATTRRQGNFRRAFIDFDEAMENVRELGAERKAAVVFGKESKGLSNESLRECDWYTTFPTSADYPSINLAQAVMLVCFSIYSGKSKGKSYDDFRRVSKKEFESVMKKFNEAIKALEYKPLIAERIDVTFRDIVKRSGLLESEGRMIKGLSRRILERTRPLYLDKTKDNDKKTRSTE
jgi:tRNA/rRNA methyltransferase